MEVKVLQCVAVYFVVELVRTQPRTDGSRYTIRVTPEGLSL